VDLTGWGLSDNPAQPRKWTFPATNLAAHGTLIVLPRERARRWIRRGISTPAPTREERRQRGPDIARRRDADRPPHLSGTGHRPRLRRDLEGRLTFLEPTPGWRQHRSHLRRLGQAGRLESRLRFLPDRFHPHAHHNSPGATLLYSLGGALPRLTYSGGLGIGRTTTVRVQAVRRATSPRAPRPGPFCFSMTSSPRR